MRHHQFVGLQSTDAYVGRDAEMQWLDTVLSTKTGVPHTLQTPPVIAAVTGLGGSGKTQLALRYAESHSADYGAVFWIDANSEQTVWSSLRQIARLLQIGSATRVKLPEGRLSAAMIRTEEIDDAFAFKRYIRDRRQPWLLLFDGLTDVPLAQFIPRESLAPGRVLVTSRRRLAQPGWKCRELGGLDSAAARELLLYYLDFYSPSAADVSQADRLVQELGFFPLSVCLAGSYIRVVGGLDQYLAYYDKMKRELLKKTLDRSGNDILDTYPVSVLVAWKGTLASLPEPATHLYYMFCTMDRTSISLDLLRRACSAKKRWGRHDGRVEEVTPRDAGVPRWLLDMCLSETGGWDELAIIEAIYRLESLFLVRRESSAGPWIYEGRVVKTLPGGEAAVLVKMERYVQEIGTLMLDDDTLARYTAGTICTAIHALEDDVGESARMKDGRTAKFDENLVALTPTGGMANDVSRLTLTLTECFGHLRSSCERWPAFIAALQRRRLANTFDSPRFSAATSCWFFLSGICLGGRSPAAACASLSELVSAVAYGATALHNSTFENEHNEDTMAYWALAALVCRTTEWHLWTKMCWRDGTRLVTRASKTERISHVAGSSMLEPLPFAPKAGSKATFKTSFLLTGAVIMEYEVASGQAKTDHWKPLSDSTSQPREIYWDLAAEMVSSFFGSLRAEPDVIQGCTWLKTLDYLPHRASLPTKEFHPQVFRANYSSSCPYMPDAELGDLVNKLRGSELGGHVYFGMVIATSHRAKQPLAEFVGLRHRQLDPPPAARLPS